MEPRWPKIGPTWRQEGQDRTKRSQDGPKKTILADGTGVGAVGPAEGAELLEASFSLEAGYIAGYIG